MFPGFSPPDLLEMDMPDLIWWHGQAEELAGELKSNG